jgi:hypothetical protein
MQKLCPFCRQRDVTRNRRGVQMAHCGNPVCKGKHNAEKTALHRARTAGEDVEAVRARYRVLVPDVGPQGRTGPVAGESVEPGDADTAGENEPDWWAGALRAAADGDRDALLRLYSYSWFGLWVEFILSRAPDDPITRKDQDRLWDMCKEEGWL